MQYFLRFTGRCTVSRDKWTPELVLHTDLLIYCDCVVWLYYLRQECIATVCFPVRLSTLVRVCLYRLYLIIIFTFHVACIDCVNKTMIKSVHISINVCTFVTVRCVI